MVTIPTGESQDSLTIIYLDRYQGDDPGSFLALCASDDPCSGPSFNLHGTQIDSETASGNNPFYFIWGAGLGNSPK